MNGTAEQFDEAKERRTNKRLAIGIGVLAVGSFIAFYIVLFLVMFLRPGLLFSIVPFPDIPTDVLSDGQRVYFLSQRPDMSGISFKEKQEPKMEHFLSVLEGEETGNSQHIPAFFSATGGMGRIVFLFEGGYRSFDGSSWSETVTDAFGRAPRGILTPDGLYVLSTFADGPRVYRITDGQASPIPVPAELADDQAGSACLPVQMIWSGNSLGLFWHDRQTAYWTSWDGSLWSQASTFPFRGNFRVLADDASVYFFQRLANGPVSLTVLRNGAWTEPVPLQLPGGFLDWFVFMHEGGPMLLARQFTSQQLYPVTDTGLGAPVLSMSGLFDPLNMISGMAGFIVVSNLATILAIFGFSGLINRYKNRYRTVDGARYEFASLFRRFLAYLIDTFAVIVPFGIAGYLFFRSSQHVLDNPLMVVLVMFIFLAFFFLADYLYHSLFEGLYGATPGKRLCGIVVLKADFTPCGLGPAFLRNLLRIPDSFFYYLVAVISLAATLKWQRIGDLAAGTVVVRRPGKM